jgi:hypothetical protein
MAQRARLAQRDDQWERFKARIRVLADTEEARWLLAYRYGLQARNTRRYRAKEKAALPRVCSVDWGFVKPGSCAWWVLLPEGHDEEDALLSDLAEAERHVRMAAMAESITLNRPYVAKLLRHALQIVKGLRVARRRRSRRRGAHSPEGLTACSTKADPS